MSTLNADVVIHIDEDLSADALADLEHKLTALAGVVAVRPSAEQRHLIIVEYERERTDAQRLLAAVIDAGVHAELVGL